MPSQWLLRAGLGLWIGVTGCAAAPFTSPLDGGAPWREITSEHFVLDTDSPEERARELVAGLEHSFELLQQVAFDYYPRFALKAHVVNFAGLANLKELGQPNAMGYATAGSDGFLSRPVIVLADGSRRQNEELLLHELPYRFVAFYTPNVPLWLNEATRVQSGCWWYELRAKGLVGTAYGPSVGRARAHLSRAGRVGTPASRRRSTLCKEGLGR